MASRMGDVTVNEDIAEYEALREYILQKEGEIANETIYMYVTYFALISIGSIWNGWLSLTTFIDLIVFQSMINGSELSVTKASIFIQIFFEENRSDIHWETLHNNKTFINVYNKINHGIGWYVRKLGASLLAMISFFSILLKILSTSKWDIYVLTSNQIAQIVVALGLCVLTIHVNRLYFKTRGDNEGQSKHVLTDSIKLFRSKSQKRNNEQG